MTAGWTQYHPNEPTIEVRDIDGRRRYLTPKQHSVLLVVRGLTETRTMRSIAEDLGYAASTVSRALTKLASFGLIAYDVVRGRYGGIELVHAVGRELKERAQTAWQKIKDARLKAERRWFVKLERSGYPFNVAPYKEWDATLTPAYAWTSADMAEVDMETP
jgi:predicted transcriptional regulator